MLNGPETHPSAYVRRPKKSKLRESSTFVVKLIALATEFRGYTAKDASKVRRRTSMSTMGSTRGYLTC
jgi:hypothetical protein